MNEERTAENDADPWVTIDVGYVHSLTDSGDCRDGCSHPVHGDAAPETDERWNNGVDWLLNHSANYDTSTLFFAYVDGIITRKEMQDEVPNDLDSEGWTRSIYEVINERREAAERVTPSVVGETP